MPAHLYKPARTLALVQDSTSCGYVRKTEAVMVAQLRMRSFPDMFCRSEGLLGRMEVEWKGKKSFEEQLRVLFLKAAG